MPLTIALFSPISSTVEVGIPKGEFSPAGKVCGCWLPWIWIPVGVCEFQENRRRTGAVICREFPILPCWFTELLSSHPGQTGPVKTPAWPLPAWQCSGSFGMGIYQCDSGKCHCYKYIRQCGTFLKSSTDRTERAETECLPCTDTAQHFQNFWVFCWSFPPC